MAASQKALREFATVFLTKAFGNTITITETNDPTDLKKSIKEKYEGTQLTLTIPECEITLGTATLSIKNLSIRGTQAGRDNQLPNTNDFKIQSIHAEFKDPKNLKPVAFTGVSEFIKITASSTAELNWSNTGKGSIEIKNINLFDNDVKTFKITTKKEGSSTNLEKAEFTVENSSFIRAAAGQTIKGDVLKGTVDYSNKNNPEYIFNGTAELILSGDNTSDNREAFVKVKDLKLVNDKVKSFDLDINSEKSQKKSSWGRSGLNLNG